MKKTRLPFKLFIICLLTMPFAYAQNGARQTPIFNHTTLYVTDLQKSAGFYKNVMELDTIPEPFKDNRHVWLKIGEHSQLHVVLGAKEMVEHNINIHLAFSVASIENFMVHLNKMQVKYGNWKGDSKNPEIRPDGIKQIYLQDPDGYWIEVNNSTF